MASEMDRVRPPAGERSEAPEPSICAGSDIRPARLGAHPRALVAGADGEASRLLESALQGGGFDVIPVEDGVAALEVICAIGPDVIVADLDGRDVDGPLLCRVVRSLSAHAMLPVLVLTSAAPQDARARGTAVLSGVRVMQKPAMPAVVAAAVSEMINGLPMVGRRASRRRATASEPRAVAVGG